MRKSGIALIMCLVLGVLSAGSCSDDKQDARTHVSDTRPADVQGNVLWEKPADGYIRAFPVADESKAYLGFCRSGELEIEAWRLTDGERVWRTGLPYPCPGYLAETLLLQGTGENLLIRFDYYVRILPVRRGIVVALNKADGSIKWELKGRRIYLDKLFPFVHTEEEIYGMAVGPETAYIFRGFNLIALDHRTGERKWQSSFHNHTGGWLMGKLVGDRLYVHLKTGRVPLRVLDTKTGKDLPPPPFPEFVSSHLNHWDVSWTNWPTIGHDGLFFRFTSEKGVSLTGFDLASGKRMWTLEGSAFYPEYAKDGKLFTLYRPPDVSRGWSIKERLWIASVDERTGTIDWHVPYEGDNALEYLEVKGRHLLSVDRVRGAQVHRVEDGSPIWMSRDYESTDTLDSEGNRLLHITKGKASLISLE